MARIILPALHKSQVKAWERRSRFTALRCGRRWGKTVMLQTLAAQHAAMGRSVGIFAPNYKILSPVYREVEGTLRPMITEANRVAGEIHLKGGGGIDFWTLQNPHAGRSRKYHLVLVDEAAFAEEEMEYTWNNAIAPTLLDYKGHAWAMSTPHGIDDDNWFYRICTDRSLGWTEIHAPTAANPFLDAAEVESLKDRYPPLVYRQEYLAEFVDWKGEAFFSEDSLLENGEPVANVPRMDHVFAVMDTAMKDGVEHDGTAIIWCGKTSIPDERMFVFDWDVMRVEGATLESLLPSIYERLEGYATQYNARIGNAGIWIEDRASGTVLLQQARNKGIDVTALPEKLAMIGKEGRALDVSPYVWQGRVKLTPEAYGKQTRYRGIERNHLLSQVCGFRMGVRTEHQMDLLDAFCYAVAISMGNARGF